MEIIFEKNNDKIVESNWEAMWQPKDKKQWKDGRSSKELAKFASSVSFQSLIYRVLCRCGIEEQNFLCEPEAKNSLGRGFNKGCRNHDLLMVGDKDCVIGIEAKVDESFDDDWKEVLCKQKEKYNGDVTKTRAYKLRKYLADGEDVGDIGYQLFTATRGTISSALDKKKSKCVVLIIVFDGKIQPSPNHNDKVNKNNKDFQKFCKIVRADGKPLHLDGVECWIKKVTVTISNTYYFK